MELIQDNVPHVLNIVSIVHMILQIVLLATLHLDMFWMKMAIEQDNVKNAQNIVHIEAAKKTLLFAQPVEVDSVKF